MGNIHFLAMEGVVGAVFSDAKRNRLRDVRCLISGVALERRERRRRRVCAGLASKVARLEGDGYARLALTALRRIERRRNVTAHPGVTILTPRFKADRLDHRVGRPGIAKVEVVQRVRLLAFNPTLVVGLGLRPLGLAERNCRDKAGAALREDFLIGVAWRSTALSRLVKGGMRAAIPMGRNQSSCVGVLSRVGSGVGVGAEGSDGAWEAACSSAA
jgi:hypothetical protein